MNNHQIATMDGFYKKTLKGLMIKKKIKTDSYEQTCLLENDDMLRKFNIDINLVDSLVLNVYLVF